MGGSLRELAFIDCGLENYEDIAGSLRANVEPIILRETPGALEQIQLILAKESGLKAIHILAHGSPGRVHFSSSSIDRHDIAADPNLIHSFRAALDNEGALQFWCCETGKGWQGGDFVSSLRLLIGRAVAAASAVLGARTLGGSWMLDRSADSAASECPLTPLAQASFAGTLASNNATTGTDNISQSGGSDTLVVSTTNQVQAADYFNGNNGFDTILLSALTGGTINLSAAGIDATHGFHEYEALTFNNASGTTTAILNASQFGVGLIATNLAVTGTAARQAITINNASFFSADLWTFTNWTSGVDTITINGTSGSDMLTGSSQADTINGGAGNDTIIGGASADILTGGLGADTFVIRALADLAASETINGTAETATLDTLRLDAAGTYNFSSFSTISNIDRITLNQNAVGFSLTLTNNPVSTADADQTGIPGEVLVNAGVAMTNGVTIDASSLTGTNRIIVDGTNLGGNDTVLVGAWSDEVNAGAGNDTIRAAVDNTRDIFDGGTGSDTVDYSAYSAALSVSLNGATPVVVSGTGNNATRSDTIANIENLIGGSGNDSFTGDAGANTFTGGAGRDTLVGGLGADTFVLRTASDLAAGETINGTAEQATLDTLRLDAAGNYNLSGHVTNIDLITLNQNFPNFIVEVSDSEVASADANGDGTGGDIFISSAVFMTNRVEIHADGLTGANRITVDGANFGGNDNMYGGAGADVISGGGGNDDIFGRAGNDAVDGGTGNDRIYGQGGADILVGGLGADTFVLSNPADLQSGDVIDGTAEAGTLDTLHVMAGAYDFSAFTTISNIDRLTLGVNDPFSTQVTISNSLVSTADADGDGTGGDLLVDAFYVKTVGMTVNASALTGVNRITVDGTNLGGSDIITGGAGADILNGGAGVDTIAGGAGNDMIIGGLGADNLNGGLGADTFVISAAGQLAAGETINGTMESGTIDTLRLDAGGAYNLSTFSISNVDQITLNQNTPGFNVDVTNGQVSSADADGNGIGGDMMINSAVAMTNGVTINAAGLTGTNRIIVDGANLGGSDSIAGGAGSDLLGGGGGTDTISGGAGSDTITGGLGADLISGGLGSDTFIVESAGELDANEAINGVAEAGTIDTLRLDAAGGYDLSTFTTISNIDQIALNQNATGFNLTVSDSQVSSADADGNGAGGDMLISSAVAMTNGVTISAAGLTGVNRITVDGTNLGGADIITGGAGADALSGGAGADSIAGGGGTDTITGGLGADTLSGGNDNDTFNVSFADTVAGESVDGGNGTDTIRIADGSGHSGNPLGQGVVLAAAALNSIERLEFATSASPNFWHQTILNASQIGTGLSSTLEVQGDSNGNIIIVGVDPNQSVSLAGWTFSGFGGNAGASDQLFINGSGGAETIIGSSYGDFIGGGAGSDTITGGGGNDTIDGGAGTNDTAIYSGAWNDYEITDNGDGSYTIVDTRSDSPDATDTVRNVELFQFSNGTFAASTILNDPPVASNDDNSSDVVAEAGGNANGTPGDDAASGDVLANDSDPDSTLGDLLTVVAARAGSEISGGSLTAVNGATAIAGTYGTLHINPDGTYTYNLDNNSNATEALSAGQIAADQFTYELTDSHGATDLAQIDITITGANDAPVAQSDIGVGDPVLPSGLIAYWSADGTTEDAVGGNDGVLQNGASYATGMFGQAFSFDGVDDVLVAPSTGLPTGNSDRTISLWVKADAFTTGESLLAGYGTFGSFSQTYQLGTSGDTLFFSQWGQAVFGPSLEAGRWYNVAVTNVGNSVTLYLDGVVVGTGTLPINTPADTDFLIGARPSGGSIPGILQGEVDGVQVYDRALTAEEIQSIYDTDLSTLPIGNVLSNDTDVDSGDSMSVIGVAAGTSAEDVSGNVGSAVIGTYGLLTLGSDGTWSYALDNSDPDTQQLGQDEAATDMFTYTMADAHGATSTTTLTITIHGTNNQPTLTIADTSVDMTEGDGEFTPLTLEGAAGEGAPALSDAQLDPVIAQAIEYWDELGASGGELAKLRAADVVITDLGGTTLAATDGSTVWIDDDAAGQGWSLKPDSVTSGDVDLLSAVEHEFGHLLGYDHDVMGATLAVGERIEPLSSENTLASATNDIDLPTAIDWQTLSELLSSKLPEALIAWQKGLVNHDWDTTPGDSNIPDIDIASVIHNALEHASGPIFDNDDNLQTYQTAMQTYLHSLSTSA